jgi:hypothetical protein
MAELQELGEARKLPEKVVMVVRAGMLVRREPFGSVADYSIVSSLTLMVATVEPVRSVETAAMCCLSHSVPEIRLCP